MTLKILDWRITVGLSFLSLILNLTYFQWLDHNWVETWKMSITSLFAIGTTHLAHAYNAAQKTA
jgi:hypothetical protein